MRNILGLLFFALLTLSCNDEPISRDKEITNSIAGSWLFVEYGYSPGAGYIKVPVPPVPPKTITFESDFSMSSIDMVGMENFKYYRLLEDTVADTQVVAFFEEDPGNAPLDLSGLSPSYNIHWEGNNLNLNYRWCIEGCHMKLERVSSAETD